MNINQQLSMIKKMNKKTKKLINYFLKHSKKFTLNQKLTKKEIEIINESCRFNNIKTKQCFYNSQMICLESEGKLKYYEGWFNDLLPLEHGWNVLNGKLVDKTGELLNLKSNTEYLGINIPLNFIRKNMLNTGMAESLLFKYIKTKVE